MPMTDALLPEFDHEMGTTRKLLERAPEDRFGWRPHEKSMTLGRLATHLAEIPTWVGTALSLNEFNMEPGTYTPKTAASRGELLALFDENLKQARALLAGKTDQELLAPWTFKREGRTLFTLPKVGVIRTWVLNHSFHHRGQLSVYLRLNDVPLPSIYGPSADQQ